MPKTLDTQKAQEITITGSSGLGKEDIERMVREAEAHKEEDEKRREQVELKAEYISSIEEGLKEKGKALMLKRRKTSQRTQRGS